MRPIRSTLRLLHDIVNFMWSAWRYRAWLAGDGDFDWDSLAQVMEMKLRAS